MNKYNDIEAVSDAEYEYIHKPSNSHRGDDTDHRSRGRSRSSRKEEDDQGEEETIEIHEFDMSKMGPISVDDKGVKIVVIGKPGCFAKGTPILMYNGSIKSVENIVVGDVLMGDDHTPRTVQELYHDMDQMYEIKPERDTSYVVNRLHDLVLLDGNETIEISVEEYLNREASWKGGVKCITSEAIRSWTNPDVNINYFNLGSMLGELYLETNTYKRLMIVNKYNMTHLLRKYNLINESINVPFEYKTSDYASRKYLLGGLINTLTKLKDIGEKTYRFYFKSQCPLINDIRFIAKSVGHDVVESYDIEREMSTLTVIHRDSPYCDFQVIAKEYGEYFGFRLDGNRRFLLGNFEVVKNTGKSTLIQDILAHKAHIIPVSQIFSGTEESNHFYSEKMPPITIFNKLDMTAVKNFVERQDLAKKYLKNPWAVQIIDDCTDNPRILKDPLFQAYYKNGRHWKMLHILSLQYSLDIAPTIRACIDYTFILRETSIKMRENLWRNYASCIDSFSDFCQIMDQVTNDYTALVVNNKSQSNRIEDCLFYYKAQPDKIPVQWKFGAGSFWQYHHDRFNKDFVETFV